MGTVCQKHAQPGTTCLERSPSREAGLEENNPFFLHFPSFSVPHQPIKPRHLQGEWKTKQITPFFVPVCWVGLIQLGGYCRGYPECVVGDGVDVSALTPLPPLLPASSPQRPTQTPREAAGGGPQPVPTSARLLLWHPIQVSALWTPGSCPKPRTPCAPHLAAALGGSGSSGDTRGHRRRGSHVRRCCWSWLTIVPGGLGNTNRSGGSEGDCLSKQGALGRAPRCVTKRSPLPANLPGLSIEGE